MAGSTTYCASAFKGLFGFGVDESIKSFSSTSVPEGNIHSTIGLGGVESGRNVVLAPVVGRMCKEWWSRAALRMGVWPVVRMISSVKIRGEGSLIEPSSVEVTDSSLLASQQEFSLSSILGLLITSHLANVPTPSTVRNSIACWTFSSTKIIGPSRIVG